MKTAEMKIVLRLAGRNFGSWKEPKISDKYARPKIKELVLTRKIERNDSIIRGQNLKNRDLNRHGGDNPQEDF